MNIDKILRKWRVMFLMVVLVWSVFQLKPWAGLDLDWGFDIQGGARVVLQPTNQSVDLEDITQVLQNRLNIYGLRDIRVRGASDLESSFIVVEAAGLTEADIENLLASEGYFEGRINNITIFTGDDVKVDKANLRFVQDPTTKTYQYNIPIILSPEASKKFADITQSLFSTGAGGRYLDAPLDLFIDGQLLESLQISADMRGREVPSAQVTGGAETREEAKSNMNQMIAILMTGSIPTKLEIVSVQTVSPLLGHEFLWSTVVAGALAAVFVGIVIFIRYRSADIVGAVLFTSMSELVITVGIASFINWQLDLSAIAGLIITIGTGLNQQIIMTDEVMFSGSKHGIKEAMFVIMAAFGTMASAMLPLVFIGVGTVRGFAVTTIMGLTVGYFITRPSYLAALEDIL